MSDRYLDFTHSAFGAQLASLLGLPQPPRLQRADQAWASQALAEKAVLVTATSGAQLSEAMIEVLHKAGASLRVLPQHVGLGPVKAAAAKLQVNVEGNPDKQAKAAPSHALVMDASGVSGTAGLREVYEFFNAAIAGVPANGRVLILSRAPSDAGDINRITASSALRGFLRSLAKEIGKKGATANLLEVEKGGEAWLAAPMQFFLSEHSAFVSGQVLTVSASKGQAPALAGSLAGKVALVTGAARGIGASIAQTLAREGAKVIGMDHPTAEGALAETMAKIDGVGIALDVTAKDAAERIAEEVGKKFGGLDIVVHNAGVTRDKMIRNMPPHYWDMVLNINLGAILNITEGLLKKGLNEGARIVCISSIGGISGNAGQTNYGATKAGVIGYCDAMAATLAKRGGAINAVAPGFIETAMTAQMPMGPREVGRRLNSLSQGGQPQDIAEAVAFFASAAAGGINGRTLRVCGQNFVGA